MPYKALLILSLFLLNSCFLVKPITCKNAKNRLKDKKTFSLKEEKKLKSLSKTCLKTGKEKEAIFILESLLKRENNLQKIKEYEKNLAELYFYGAFYKKAIKKLSNLRKKALTKQEQAFVQDHLIKSFFNLKKHEQVIMEAKKGILIKELSKEKKKSFAVFQGKSLVAMERFEEAIKFFKAQIENFPEEETFFREQISLIYQAEGNLTKALESLDQIPDKTPFIDKKMEKIRKRLVSEP